MIEIAVWQFSSTVSSQQFLIYHVCSYNNIVRPTIDLVTPTPDNDHIATRILIGNCDHMTLMEDCMGLGLVSLGYVFQEPDPSVRDM